MSMTIGRRAKIFRDNLGLTQPEAAERAGISQASWSRIETDHKTPTAGEVLGLSWALGVPFDTILGKSRVRNRLRFAGRSSEAVSDDDKVLAVLGVGGVIVEAADPYNNDAGCSRIDDIPSTGGSI
jgi:transcriptional regulator with XRE-family HTH domain